MSVRFEPVVQFGDFASPLRNIRANLDECRLTLDLIPSQLGEIVKPAGDDPVYLKAIVGQGREILETQGFLRLDFEFILAWVVHEEFSETGAFKFSGDGWPTLAGKQYRFPFVKVIDSPWLAEVPEDRLPTEGVFYHFRIVSMTTYMDVLAQMPHGRWMP